jgi:hypothetical protein
MVLGWRSPSTQHLAPQLQLQLQLQPRVYSGSASA